MASIFIQIPSYRDHELPVTIQNAIDMASGSNTLVFGVHNCVMYPGEVLVDISAPDWVEIRYLESIAPENIGLQLSRYLANAHYSGEDFYLQIDSHMRFAQDWDLIAIKSLTKFKDLGIAKPLLTGYPGNYWYSDSGELRDRLNSQFTRISFQEFPEQFKASLIPSQLASLLPKACGFTASVSGGAIFTLGEFAAITPNKKIAFWGEEILIAARAFTHGFTLLAIDDQFLWHLYYGDGGVEKNRRHHCWQDWPDIWGTLDTASRKEVERIFTERIVGEGALGSIRSLEDYEIFAGLDFKKREVTQKFK